MCGPTGDALRLHKIRQGRPSASGLRISLESAPATNSLALPLADERQRRHGTRNERILIPTTQAMVANEANSHDGEITSSTSLVFPLSSLPSSRLPPIEFVKSTAAARRSSPTCESDDDDGGGNGTWDLGAGGRDNRRRDATALDRQRRS